jgi:hypothetical protein
MEIECRVDHINVLQVSNRTAQIHDKVLDMYSHFQQYHVVLWLYADTTSKLETQCIHLARALGISEDAREAIMQWINHLSLHNPLPPLFMK